MAFVSSCVSFAALQTRAALHHSVSGRMNVCKRVYTFQNLGTLSETFLCEFDYICMFFSPCRGLAYDEEGASRVGVSGKSVLICVCVCYWFVYDLRVSANVLRVFVCV